MIAESSYWKNPLLEMAKRMNSLKTSGDFDEEQLAQVERDIFVGFYSVRKLFEATAKITDTTKAMKVPLLWHPNREHVTWLNSHRLNELYDFSISNAEVRDVIFICGRIIHSYIFTPCMEKFRLCGIFFTSDIDLQLKLYYMGIDEVIKIFEQVGNDYPSSIEWRKDDTTGKETTIVK